MCLSVFAHIDRIASPPLDFLVGACTLAMGWLSASVGTLLFIPPSVLYHFFYLGDSRLSVIHPFCVHHCCLFLQQMKSVIEVFFFSIY